METAIERKRRLRRERILQNSESRLRRIVGGEPATDPVVDPSAREVVDPANDGSGGVVPTGGVVLTGGVVPTGGVRLPANHSVSSSSAPSRSPSTTTMTTTTGSVTAHRGIPNGDVGGDDAPDYFDNHDDDDATDASVGKRMAEVNGFHRHLRRDEAAMSAADEAASTASTTDDLASATGVGAVTLDHGAFGFDASKLKRRSGEEKTEDWTKDAIAVEDEEELRGAKELLLRDHHYQSAGAEGVAPSSAAPLSRQFGGAQPEPPLRMRKMNSTKRSSKEDALRNELERLIQQEPGTQKCPKPTSRQNTARRKASSSLWYTKTWFRTSFAILLALFVRVLMQIKLSDYFSDSAFYPFFSMELSFFVAAFCSKPPGYRIPIGGGVVEAVINLLGFSREILGNLKWFYEFAFQKPVEEFSLYFFFFSISHLILEHVQERASLSHDEL